ncbi:MAG: WYL domain-containing protein [Acidimicrobiaceae bacterium]|nr:WYL domain-containing protein [Acidimicrobiaceae bacterium]
MDRLERLVNLVAALLDAPRPLRREELRERVGGYSDDPAAFRRNFERDKDALRQMGMPLVLEPIEGDHPDAPTGYRIPRERYELPDLGLTEDELAALRVAASAVEIQGDEGATASALRKLAAGIAPVRNGDSSWNGKADADGPGSSRRRTTPVAEVPGGEAVAVVWGAIAERRRLSFTYRDRPRTVEPWQLAYRSGRWYLTGLDRERGASRLYRLDRVQGSVRALDERGAFIRPEVAAVHPPRSWQLGDEPETMVRILIDAVVAPTALSSVGEEAIEERRPDGSVVVALPVSSMAALYAFVLGFLERAEILDPPEVRADFVGHLEALARG